MSIPLNGQRILVVEDEYFIATDIRRTLSAGGADVLGPVGTTAEAFALLPTSPDAAVLDVNLDGDRSFAVAEHLAERGIPYLFLTGYDAWALPERHRDAPRLAKPFTAEALLNAVRALFEFGPRS